MMGCKMKIDIDFDYPVLPYERLCEIRECDLNQSYSALSEVDQLNLFFMLLTTLCECEKAGRRAESEHLCYLISYYLFVLLTPPGSAEIALYYAEKAAVLSGDEERYKNWIEYVKKGN